MPENIVKPTGATKASKNDAGGGVIRSEPVMAVVKNNIDPIRAGRIQVFIEDLNGSDPEDSSAWVTMGFLSPFYGRSYPSGGATGYGDYTSNPVSYGEWHSPPEIGTRVICVFVNGDPNYGYYIGSIPEPEALTMVPAIGAVESKVVLNAGEAGSLAGATQLPVTNLNDNNSALSESNDFLNAPKPVHSYVASILAQQGLIRDNIRGPITSNAQRETPSRVGWGVSTPGRPIYDGGYTDATIEAAAQSDTTSSTKIISRRAGHTFVMDDGDLVGKDQLIRLRTSLGHQILMSDDGQCLFIIHANGQSWVELGAEGTIDMFATNSVNVRTQGDLNLHADNDVNINAGNNININSKQNLNVNSDQATSIRTGTDFHHQALSNFTTKVGGTMSMGAGGEGSYAAGGTMYVNGSVVNLNTGSTSLPPPEVQPIPLIAQTDTLFDDAKGFAPVPAQLETIVTRAPAHQPWAMAGKGVDVKIKVDASQVLPTAPSPEVQSANNTSPSAPATPLTLAATATVPSISGLAGSAAGTTSSLVSAAAASAGTSVPSLSTVGSAITNGAPQVGQLGQTAGQLVTGGALKPGADTLVNGLTSQGASVSGAMTNNLFTGQAGATSLPALVNSVPAQAASMATNLASSQSQLTQAGVLTGNENPASVAGVVLAGAQNGVADTANFVQSAAANPAAAASSQLGSAAGGIAQNISLGNLAGGLSSNLSGALSGLTASLGSALKSAEGAISSAFSAITGAYKNFTPNVPQDLTAIAKAGSSSSSSSTPSLGSLASNIPGASALASTATAATSAASGIPGASAISSSITDATATATAGAANLAAAQSGLQGIPGGANVLAATVNNAPSAAGMVSSLPGASSVNSLMSNTTAGLMNNIPTSAAGVASAAGALTGSASGALGSLTGSASGALGSLTSSSLPNTSGLLSGVTSSLPAGLAGQLSSAISSISSGGPTQVKLPTVATNTIDRSTVTSQIGSILGNPKIPMPQFSSDDSAEDTDEEDVAEADEQFDELESQLDDQYVAVQQTRNAYLDALNNLPAGDPGIVSAQAAYDQATNQYQSILDQINTA